MVGFPAIVGAKQPREAGYKGDGEDDGDVEIATTGRHSGEEDSGRGNESEEGFHRRRVEVGGEVGPVTHKGAVGFKCILKDPPPKVTACGRVEM